MKVTVGQFNIKAKDLRHNYNEIKRLSEEAILKQFDMIVFGEYALSSYACGELFNDRNFYNEIEYYTNKLKDLSRKITLVFGSVKRIDNKNYVTTTILHNKKEYTSYKNNLNKREFSELRFFTSKENLKLQMFDQEVLFTFRSDFNTANTSDLVVVIDSSPVNNNLEKFNIDLVYANTLGVSNTAKTVFINGGSSYINIDNKFQTFKNAFSSGIDLAFFENKIVSKLEALTYGLKVFSNDNFGPNKKWILGNSGGLDSAVTLSLLTMALGAKNVVSYNLRSKYNSDKTVNNASSLASKLNVKHYNVKIDKEVDAYLEILKDVGYTNIDTLTYENIQARTRGHLLGGFSSLENAVISNNGNKLELALGYATLYGDTIGALSIIGDLLKIEVFELGHEINNYFNEEIIPYNLLPKVNDYSLHFDVAPSAELKHQQVDPMKWFYHDYLLQLILKISREEILSMYLDNQFSDLEIAKWLKYYNLNIGKNFIDDFNWFYRSFEINHFKRLQTPPVLAYSNNVIAYDFLEVALVKSKSDKLIDLEKLIVEKYV